MNLHCEKNKLSFWQKQMHHHKDFLGTKNEKFVFKIADHELVFAFNLQKSPIVSTFDCKRTEHRLFCIAAKIKHEFYIL